MKKSFELKQERTAKVEAQQKIVDAAKTANRDLTEQEAADFDALSTEIDNYKTKIERAERTEANEALLATRTMAPVTTDVTDGESKEKGNIYKRASIIQAIKKASPDHRGGLDGAEKELHEIGSKAQRDAAVNDKKGGFDNVHLSIPMDFLYQRADQQTVSQDSGNYGGALVQPQTLRYKDQLSANTVFEKLGAEFLSGLTGGDLPIIVGSDFDMAFMAETTAITVQKKQFTGPTLSPNRAGGAVDISNRLLLQNSVGIDNKIRMELAKGFTRLLNQSCLEGTTYITGLLTYSGVNTTASTAVVVPTWAKIVDFQTKIFEDNSTRENLGYIVHPVIEGLLKTVAKDSGSGRFLLENGKIDAYNYQATSLITPLWDEVPTYPTFFGDFSQMTIGQWGAINVTINPYSADLSNSLRLVLNTYADMVIANPAAFCRDIHFAETAGS